MNAKARVKKKATPARQEEAAEVSRALRRAAKDARKTARMRGTPLYVWEKGTVVATTP